MKWLIESSLKEEGQVFGLQFQGVKSISAGKDYQGQECEAASHSTS